MKITAIETIRIAERPDLVGLRPEDLSLAPAGDGEIALTGQLMPLEPAGAESLLHLTFEGIKDTIVA